MQTVQDRLRFALRDGLVIAGILAAWLLARTVVVLVLQVPADLLGLRPFVALFGLVRDSLPLFETAALLNVSLYVLVRAGTVVVERHAELA